MDYPGQFHCVPYRRQRTRRRLTFATASRFPELWRGFIVTPFQHEFSQYSAIAFARQLAFAEFLGVQDWQLDMPAGTVDFGEGRVYPIQLLGTEADDDDTWLWAWANEESDVPDDILQDCRAIRDAGEEKQLEELTAPSFSLEEVDGHSLALFASGFIGDCAYFRGRQPGGAVFFLVKDLPPELLERIPSRHALTTVMQLIYTFEVNHRKLIESFFQQAKYEIFSDSASVVGTAPDGGMIDVTFDEQGQITDLRGKRIPDAKPKYRWWKYPATRILKYHLPIALLSGLIVAAVLYLSGWYYSRESWIGCRRQSMTRSKLFSLGNSIDQYHQKNGEYPPSIEELVAAPNDDKAEQPNPTKWTVDESGNAYEYSIDKDEWGRPFEYSADETGFTLKSLGRDRKPGGIGLDADLYHDDRNHNETLATLWQFLTETDPAEVDRGMSMRMSLTGAAIVTITLFFQMVFGDRENEPQSVWFMLFAAGLVIVAVIAFFVYLLSVLSAHGH